MTQDFGSPNAGDATAKREKRILTAVGRRQRRLEQADKIINRPIGSKVDLSDEEQIEDWEALINDTQALVDKIGQLALAFGPDQAKLKSRRWDKEMRLKVK